LHCTGLAFKGGKVFVDERDPFPGKLCGEGIERAKQAVEDIYLGAYLFLEIFHPSDGLKVDPIGT